MVQALTWVPETLCQTGEQGTYYARVTGDCGTPQQASITITSSAANTWTGAFNTGWNNASNWSCNTVPAPGANIIIGTSAFTPALPGALSVGNLTLQGNINLNGQTLTISGVVSGTGTITGSVSSSLYISGDAGTINFTAGGQLLKDLTLGHGASATLGTPLSIAGGADFGTVTLGTGTTLNSNGNLTLKSDLQGTARVGISGSIFQEMLRLKGIYLKTQQGHGECYQCQQKEHKLPGRPGRRMETLQPVMGTLLTNTTGTNGYDAATSGNSFLTYNTNSHSWVSVPSTMLL
jgi:hypothetical protein